MKDGYKDVGDLYADGEVLKLRNGKLVWVQVLNSFELDECRTAARVAKARTINALEREDSPEAQIVRSQFRRGRRDLSIAHLLEMGMDEISLKVAQEIEADPEWEATMELLTRSNDIASRGPTDEEARALEEASIKYVQQINRRMDEEQELRRLALDALDDEQLEQEIVDAYIIQQGNHVAMEEYRLREIALAARTCDAEWDEANEIWKHQIPISEREPIWSPEEARKLPEPLQAEIQAILRKLNMTGQTAKDSAEVASSSDSSLPPSEGEASQPSTPTEMSVALPGT